MKITNIIGREILDSRGNPTVEAEVHVNNARAISSSPSGASVGSREALELRDKDPKRFAGKGVLTAVNNVNTIIKQALIGKNCDDQKEIDAILLELDGTNNKSKLGANATLATSSAILKSAALMHDKPLFNFLNHNSFTLPIPQMNLLNGGAHADNDLDIQEFMIMPIGAKNIKHAIQIGAEVFFCLREILKKKNMSISIGDEGGVAPMIKESEEALALLMAAIEKAGYAPGQDVALALDVASSEFYKNDQYHLKGINKTLDKENMIRFYENLVNNFPIISIEDPMAEHDVEGWQMITQTLGNRIQLVGDDVFVTNKQILEEGIRQKIANAILIKPNQVGTITETKETVDYAQNNDYNCIMSHRSGETESTLIAHLAVAYNCPQIKTGGMCRIDRISKYNELIRIEEYLGNKAKFAKFQLNNKL
jgi:enolase